MFDRRWLILIVVLLGAAVASAACTAAPPTPLPSPTAAPVSPPTSPAPTTAAAPKIDLGGYKGPALTTQPVKLRLMRQVFGAETDWWTAVEAAFTKAYPNITIEEEVVPYGDLTPKLMTYVAAGNAPDISMSKGSFVWSLVYNGIPLNLNTYLTDAYMKDIAPSVMNQQSVGGNLYCMPWEQGQTLLWYNRDWLDTAGITPPYQGTDATKGMTWDEAMDFWKKLNAYLNPQGGTPTKWALAPSTFGAGGAGSTYWLEGMFIRSMGDPNAAKDSSLYKTFLGVSPDGTQASGYVDTPEAIQGMKIYQNIFTQKYSQLEALSRAWEDGKAATKWGQGTGEYRNRNPANLVKFKWGSTPAPRGKIFFSHTSSDCLVISAKTKYPAEAAAFMGFIHNDANRVAWHRLWGSVPARLSLFDKMPEYKTAPFDMFAALTLASYPNPVTPGYLEYESAMNKAIKDIAYGADPEKRLHDVAKELDGLLATYKK